MNTKTPLFLGLIASSVALTALAGCGPKPTTMAPPVSAPQQMAAPPVAAPAAPVASNPDAGVYNWRDVPPNQEVPIVRAVFDQGGYQLYAESGETIVVPFENQNMYVMKFGKSNSGAQYFVNENGKTPLLYVRNGGYLENAAAQGAKWYPFANDFQYSRPVYLGIAPSWSAYTGMGWYPGMTYYGGYWGYNPWVPGFAYTPMVGLYFNIGGRPYYGWNSYNTYYRSNPVGRVGWSRGSSFNYASVGRRSASSGSFGRSVGSTGSFGRGRNSAGSFGRNTASTSSGSFGRGTSSGSSSFGRASNSSGSFGRGTTSGSSSFGRASGSSGSFGRSGSAGSAGSAGSSSFGTARNTTSGSSSFGRSGASTGSASSGFGSSSRSRGSFGSGSSGFGSSGSSGSSFGRSSSGSSSSSSFGRSSSSSSFGRSSGGSFGGGRSGGRRR